MARPTYGELTQIAEMYNPLPVNPRMPVEQRLEAAKIFVLTEIAIALRGIEDKIGK